MSLSHLLNTNLETIPETIPYLHADQDKIKLGLKDLERIALRSVSAGRVARQRLILGALFHSHCLEISLKPKT